MRRMPLITGFSDSVIWSAGPLPHPMGNSAYWREQALASLSFYCRAPYEILARAWPGDGEGAPATDVGIRRDSGLVENSCALEARASAYTDGSESHPTGPRGQS